MQSQMTKRQEMESRIISEICKPIPADVIKTITSACIQQALDSTLQKLEAIQPRLPSTEEIESTIDATFRFDFDDDAVESKIRRFFPGWSDDRIDEELDKLQVIYDKECDRQIELVTQSVLKACGEIETVLKQEIADLKTKLQAGL